MGLFSFFLGRKKASQQPPAAAVLASESVQADNKATVRLVLEGCGDSPAADIPDEQLHFAVQLQESFSPGKAVHLILLPTSKEASGSLPHDVGAWLNTAQESEWPENEAQQTPKKSGLLGKLSRKKSPVSGSKSRPATDSPHAKPWSIASR